jgi:flagellar basal-body rod modification protein FlgD
MTIFDTHPTSPAPLAQVTASAKDANGTGPTSTANFDNLGSEDTFLKLFVAQLQNQDPLNPNEQDPTQMVSELAQFSQLEQLVNIGQNVQSIDQTIAAANTAGSSSSAASGNSGTGANGAATSSAQA